MTAPAPDPFREADARLGAMHGYVPVAEIIQRGDFDAVIAEGYRLLRERCVALEAKLDALEIPDAE